MKSPAIGQVVHYVSHGTPPRSDGTQAYVQACRAAIVTEVAADDPIVTGLCVLNPTGQFFRPISEGGCLWHGGAGEPGDPDCPASHGGPFRYCGQRGCGWTEDGFRSGTWHRIEQCR